MAKWNVGRSLAVGSVAVLGLVTLAASNPPKPSDPPTKPTTGSVFVEVGFGAKSNPPYKCVTEPPVTAALNSSAAGGASMGPQTVGFPNSSDTIGDGPGCVGSVTFLNVAPGNWVAVSSLSSAPCPVTVVAGQSATVKIHHGVCR